MEYQGKGRVLSQLLSYRSLRKEAGCFFDVPSVLVVSTEHDCRSL